ncbi:hypothetical protein L6452_44298 [Arctium lappa]|uniref:Uncharacterized protein n=1 Tax=Arctium lappa TaxID=4217 RepID=A0ACB8XF95_ARCLA|nr:hypothetical protein L6452_44298 [Arctium lappa]
MEFVLVTKGLKWAMSRTIVNGNKVLQIKPKINNIIILIKLKITKKKKKVDIFMSNNQPTLLLGVFLTTC